MQQLDQIMISIKDIRKAIVDFSNSPETRQLSAFYGQKSSLEVLGIHRRETCHSNFLAWLLDPGESHGLAALPIQKFLEACVIALSETQQKHPSGLPSHVLDDLMVGMTHIGDASVETEKQIGKNGRVDIYVECFLGGSSSTRRLHILIENKVDSSEHDSQTNRYNEWLNQTHVEGDLFLQVYLTPLPTMTLAELDEPQCQCKDFLQINYQYLVDYLIEPALSLTKSEQARGLLRDYLRALTISAVARQDNRESGDLIMAISEHERKLLTKFWEQNRSLILAAFYAISNDPNQDKEVRDEADRVIKTMSNRDFSLYTVQLDGKVVAGDVKKTAVGREVARTLIETGISDDAFQRLRCDKSSNFQLLKQEEEITDAEWKYNRYRVGRDEPLLYQNRLYHVSGNWGENNIPRLQQFLAKNFPRLQVRKQSAEPTAQRRPRRPLEP